jgi:hypothetical protein
VKGRKILNQLDKELEEEQRAREYFEEVNESPIIGGDEEDGLGRPRSRTPMKILRRSREPMPRSRCSTDLYFNHSYVTRV